MGRLLTVEPHHALKVIFVHQRSLVQCCSSWYRSQKCFFCISLLSTTWQNHFVTGPNCPLEQGQGTTNNGHCRGLAPCSLTLSSAGFKTTIAERLFSNYTIAPTGSTTPPRLQEGRFLFKKHSHHLQELPPSAETACIRHITRNSLFQPQSEKLITAEIPYLQLSFRSYDCFFSFNR